MATRRFFDGAQIEIGSLPIESAAVAQTITLNRLESTASIFNPTVVLNTSFIITLNRLESGAQVFLPTVTQVGSVQTITLNRLESTAQVFLPTVNLISAITDTSDILNRPARKRRYKLTKLEEEEIAAQLLLARKGPQEEQVAVSLDWRKLIYNAVNGVTSEAELAALNIPMEGITSPSATAAVLAEIEKQKELKRLEFEIKKQEAELKAAELTAQIQEKEAAIVAAIADRQKQLELAKREQEQALERFRIAQATAEQEEMQSYLEAMKAEQEFLAFKTKRDNRIKRLKALMWLAKLDL